MFKKLLSFLLLFTISLGVVNALSNNQKGAILERFKKKQYDLLFESNFGDFSSEYSEIFDISKKVDIYNGIKSKSELERIQAENKREEAVRKINSLTESIEQLDIDIENTLRRVDIINKKVIKTKKEIEINKETIKILKKKIDENREILLEYLIYIYIKSNTIYDEKQVDNLKSILLNGENISDIINDLYFKGIIQIAGKKLIDKHRKYISDLYMKKVSLEKQEKTLKKLRKLGIIEKKVLSDKKKFKEKILEVSKGKESYYKKFVKDKLEIEKKLRLKSFKEKIKFNFIRKKILEKYGCEFVDLSKNTAESRALTGKCLDINRMIYSETKLKEGNSDKNISFIWPVEPSRGLSAFYNDIEYKKDFGTDHGAIDIRIPQGTTVKSPADGYVIFIKPPTTQDYSYMAIKHSNGYMTVYGHLSDILVEEFQFVEAGDIIAQSGGEFGTLGSGFMTTGPHLHFEVFKDSKPIDPLRVLDLSKLKYESLPEIYWSQFYRDFAKRRGYEFKNKSKNSRVFHLEGNNEIERQKYLIKKYAVGSFNNWQMWIDESLDGNIDPSLVMCIGLAESTLGKNLSSPYNIGNVGNNDRGDRVALKNARSGIYLIIHTLNNDFHKDTNSLAKLSGEGRALLGYPGCTGNGNYCYATDTNHWHRNVKKCLSHLKGTYVSDEYNFRLLK